MAAPAAATGMRRFRIGTTTNLNAFSDSSCFTAGAAGLAAAAEVGAEPASSWTPPASSPFAPAWSFPASAARDEARAEGRKVVEEKRGHAEEEVSSQLQDAAEQLKREGDAVAAELRARVDTISTTLASRILGVEVTTSVSATGSGR